MDKKGMDSFNKIHGQYTIGFYENELNSLRSKLNAV
jgi:hypothetical protein